MSATTIDRKPSLDAPPAPVAAAPVRRRGRGLVTPAVLLLALIFVLPVLALLLRSVLEPTPGLGNYAEFFSSSSYRKILGNTFLVASIVTAVTLLIGFPVAWLLAIIPGKWSAVLLGIIILSMWTNLLARTYAWMVLLQNTGLINRALKALGLIEQPVPLIKNLTGVTIGMVYIMLPFMILPLYATIRTLDPATMQAAALCGAGKWQVFWRIFLPLCQSGIMAGALMVFIMALGYFVTPALLGSTSDMMLAELIAQLVQSLLNWGLGAAAAFVLLTLALAVYAIQVRLVGERTVIG